RPSARVEAGIGPAAVVGRLPLGAGAGHEQHLVEALIGLEPRIANASNASLGVAGAPEVGGEHDVEAGKGLVVGGEGVATLPARVGGADFLELGRLVAVGDADLVDPPGLAALGEGGGVQVAVVGRQPHG